MLSLYYAYICTHTQTQTEEVKVKTQQLERTQSKLHSALEDNKDLAAEFEMDRQDYLDTIRKQQMTIKLQEQLLETIVPCLRRDCNYYNLDKVKAECVWDKEQAYWILPRLTVSKSVLSPVTSGSSLLERSAPNSKLPKQNSSVDMPLPGQRYGVHVGAQRTPRWQPALRTRPPRYGGQKIGSGTSIIVCSGSAFVLVWSMDVPSTSRQGAHITLPHTLPPSPVSPPSMGTQWQ